jgi:hypothetical protein
METPGLAESSKPEKTEMQEASAPQRSQAQTASAHRAAAASRLHPERPSPSAAMVELQAFQEWVEKVEHSSLSWVIRVDLVPMEDRAVMELLVSRPILFGLALEASDQSASSPVEAVAPAPQETAAEAAVPVAARPAAAVVAARAACQPSEATALLQPSRLEDPAAWAETARPHPEVAVVARSG